MKSVYRLMRPSTAMVLECRLAKKLRKRRANDTGRESKKKAVCVRLFGDLTLSDDSEGI